jgi:transcription initiation factor TFIIIB Brf1 subunit/transcription initiation factor TFIIB
MKCPRCGYREEDDAVVCSRCGKVLKETGEVLTEEHEAQVKEARASTTKRNAIVGAIAAVVVIVGGFFTYKAIVGPPAMLVGNWTNTGYGGLLALLSGGIKIQITSEAPNGQIQGTFSYNSITQTIEQGKVTGKHISLTTEKPNEYTYYIVSGTYNPSDQSIDAIVTTVQNSGNPPTKKTEAADLTKAQAD